MTERSVYLSLTLSPLTRSFIWPTEFFLAFERVFKSATWNVANPDCLVKLFRSLSRVLQKSVNPAHSLMGARD